MTDATNYFDDTRKALTFALNFESGMKAPAMSRAMSQVGEVPKRVSKAQRSRLLKQYEGAAPEAVKFLVELLDSRKTKRSRTLQPPPSPKGLDGAHLAGFVLAHFARIDEHRQTILRGRVLEAYTRCACGSPCCSKWRRQPHWADAVRRTCMHLELVGDVLRQPGKRGLSTQPEMRLALVEQFYTRNELSLVDLARIGNVSLTTAAKHKEWVYTYLEQEENSGWSELDAIFDSVGITGAFA